MRPITALLALLPLLLGTLASPLRERQEVIGVSSPVSGGETGSASTSAGAADATATAAASASSGEANVTESAVSESASSSSESSAGTSTGTSTDSAAVAAATAGISGAADTSNDLTVVKFAALAELLEKTFYEQALAKFDAQAFTDAGFVDGQGIREQLQVIATDEATHLTVLQSVATSLGSSTSDIDTCTFNFDSALTDVKTFLATARVLEFVGIDAYIGGTTLIGDKGLLVSAAEITTVESRHNTVLNTLNGGSAVPNAFDMVLTPQQILSVAAPFVAGGCDPVAALGLTPTPALTITNTDPAQPGTLLTFGGAGLNGKDQAGLFCNMIVGGATESINLPIAECKVPDGLDGAVHLFITSSSTPLGANIVTQDASLIVAGPAVTFVDTIPNAQTQLLLGTNANSAASSGTGKKKIVITQTIVEEDIV
ncbi:uncharacterized protein I303_104688 [Kwoniella dejecticola CBS 10117]|uniref:Protein rds1 n=1 Tax=Kwoniella dejecticola CBS 10117 TaxID=1296121 RepID=A0A1A6A4L4_9TREE|nr:uncharacterized protein I303_04332 [Kwoniella dejecticola CBS 10117]OBR85005.1 hypothetical protein I303_04332 [Kwoniella dejecticola CBS 10117]